MKITLISTASRPIEQGIRCLSSRLKKAGHEVNLIFMCKGENYCTKFTEDELKQLEKLCRDSDMIGVGAFIINYERTKQILKHLKKLKTTIILGGIHPTLNPEDCIKDCNIVCIGECEEAIVELADAIENNKDYKNIKNIWIRKKGKIIKNPIRWLLDDLDSLPFPDFDIDTHYILDKGNIIPFKEEHFEKEIMFLSGRGCPYGCSYCSNGKLNELFKGHRTKIVRNYSVDYSIKFLNSIINKFKSINYLDLRDDTFTVRSVKEIKEFCKRYKKEVGIRFRATVDAKSITEEKIKSLVDAGCVHITLGIEGSERVNTEVYNRNITYKDVLRTAKILNKYTDKFSINYDLMCCNYYDTEKDLLEVISLVRKMPKPYRLFPNALILFPNSQLYNQAVNDGYVKSIKDSGMDLNYHERGENIQRVNKNIYLNSIVIMFRGINIEKIYGSIPVWLLNILTRKGMISFFNDSNYLTHLIPYGIRIFDFTKYKILKPCYDKLPKSILQNILNFRSGNSMSIEAMPLSTRHNSNEL